MTRPSLTAIVLALAASSASAALPLLPIGEKVAGLDQSGWSRAWWQWAASFGDDDSPALDTTGARCELRQQGPVWFLASAESSTPVVRACSVPAGKYLFFPLATSMTSPSPDRDLPCTLARFMSTQLSDNATQLVLRIDGRPQAGLATRRITSQGCFDAGVREEPRTALRYPAAADGYYVMLAPLAPGRHELQFGGTLPGHAKSVTYTLDVR